MNKYSVKQLKTKAEDYGLPDRYRDGLLRAATALSDAVTEVVTA